MTEQQSTEGTEGVVEETQDVAVDPGEGTDGNEAADADAGADAA